MFREDVHNTGLGQFRQLAQDLTRHQVETSAFRLQDYLYLLYHITAAKIGKKEISTKYYTNFLLLLDD